MLTSLVDSQIIELIRIGYIRDHSSGRNLKELVQPASLDLPLGDKLYVLKNKFLPLHDDVEDIIEDNSIEKIDLDENGVILYKGNTYLVPIADIDLPDSLSARLSPKSSIGRTDLLVRGIFDRTGLYDTIQESTKGRLYLECTPQSFNIRVRRGDTLSQMMLFDENHCPMDISDQNLLYDDTGQPLENTFYDENKTRLLMSLDLSSFDIVGYKSRTTNEAIDLRKKDHDSNDFFEPIKNERGRITLEKDKFYIFCTRERVSIPLQLSSEMVPFFNLVGELRVHYAGFFDPGFGYGENGEIKGLKGVLEVRPHETMTVEDGQPICLMEFYKNKKLPSIGYGTRRGNNYSSQEGPRLAKYFK
ncbi:MAG: 2'-deoxycytidine 5'-triphosphate deaminase domain-containing protein [Candidatus Woesearchaeota archaeon]